MSYIRPADYGQLHFFPPSLEELLAPDHPARFVREFAGVVLDKDNLELQWGTGDKVHALDGTRIPSCSSTRSGWHAIDLEKKLERLEEAISVPAADRASRPTKRCAQ